MGRGDWDGAERIFLAALTEAEETGDRRAALSLCSELMGFYRQRADAEKFYLVLGRCTELLRACTPFRSAQIIRALRRFITTWPRRSMRCIARTRRSGTCSARWKTRKSVPAISISR